MKSIPAVNSYLTANNLQSNELASNLLFRLFQVVHVDAPINYFLEADQDLDKVLNVFIRVNSGGTALSYSDLLLSIAAASWEHRNAREEIHELVSQLNDTGDKFAFDKDFVMKASLVLCDIRKVEFNVNNFDRPNMLVMEQNWDRIAEALRVAVQLVSDLGFNRDTLTANNAVIPVAYYCLRKGIGSSRIASMKFIPDREKIRQWLIRALLKRLFGGQSDSVLVAAREIISQELQRDSLSEFPLSPLVSRFSSTSHPLAFSEDDIDNLVMYRYGQAYAFLVLALLYPSLDFKNKFHLDHLYPRSMFTRKRLTDAGLDADMIQEYTEEHNCVPNLQLLEGAPNIEKGNKPLREWLESTFTDPQLRRDYMERHYIPAGVSLEIKDFLEFYRARRDLMVKKLKDILRT